MTKMFLTIKFIVLKKYEKNYLWFFKLRTTPKVICVTPKITDTFILYEFKNKILFFATCHT